MMRVLFLGLAMLIALPQIASARPNTTRMSCDEAHSLVIRSGAIVMSTGRHTYERFVADRRFCQFNEVLERQFVPTADRQQCFVGYRCVLPYNDDCRFGRFC
ncbi:MAG: hypothetical protein KDJ16_14670 [Hyphomicrobiales bacterium]|nr:hypothetical protein [Hyphomicrobiales bacterium]